MKPSSAFYLGVVLSVALFCLSGCSDKKDQEAPPAYPIPTTIASAPYSLPFLGDDVREASQAVLENIRPLYRISYVFLGSAGVFGLLLGIRVGVGLALGGFTGLGACVLFSMFPRTVLLLPALAALFLVGWMVKWLLKRGWRGVSP